MTEEARGTGHARLQGAAAAARVVMERVAGEGSVLEQIQSGQWNHLSDQEAIDLADLVEAMREVVRHTRAVAGALGQGEFLADASEAMAHTVDDGLPLNRKERYYTGTVLPMIIAGNGFAHLDRFLALCGLPSAGLQGNMLEGLHPVAFYTEYNFAESRYSDLDKARFPGAPTDADTPDVVIAGPDWLLCVEAKVFHNPTADALNTQMARQRVLVDYWAQALHLDSERVAHVLLLPAGLATDGVHDRVVTWEDLLDAYRVVGPAYWVAVLATALDRYNDLVSVPDTYGRNAEAHMTGTQILDAHQRGTLEMAYMGRKGGLDGPLISEDLATGRWRTQTYETRSGDLPGNRNWFPIQQFLERLG